MPFLLLGVASVTFLVIVMLLISRLPSHALRRMTFWFLAALTGAAILFSVLTGRWGLAVAIGFGAVSALLGRSRRAQRQDQARDDPSRGTNSSSPSLSLAEARDILGVSEEADRDEIESAFRRLIQKMHPDHGGTDWMAARLSDARRILIDHINKR